MKREPLNMSVYGLRRIGTERKSREFIELLADHRLVPLKFGSSERGQKPFGNREFVEFWVDMERRRGLGGVLIKGDNFTASISWGGAIPYSAGLRVTAPWQMGLDLFRDLCEWYEAFYGYAGSEEDSDRQYTPGLSAMQCIADVAWANYYGRPYVDMWGEEKLRNAPTWRTERLKDGGFLLVVAESPLGDKVAGDEARKRLKSYLGEEHFFKREAEEQDGQLHLDEFLRSVMEPKKPTGYVTPDFDRYLEDS